MVNSQGCQPLETERFFRKAPKGRQSLRPPLRGSD